MEKIIDDYLFSDSKLPKFFDSKDSELSKAGKHLKKKILKEIPFKKLKSLQLIRSISEYIGNHMIHKLLDWASFNKDSEDPFKGKFLFDAKDKESQQASADFLILLLDSIEFWTKLSRIGNKENNFDIAYVELCNLGVCFMRLIPKTEEIQEKIDELTENMQKVFKNINSAASTQSLKLVLKNLKLYKRTIKILINKSPDLFETFNLPMCNLSLSLRKTHEDYKLIKYKNIVKKDLTDPIPKNIPKCDSPVFVETKDCFIEYQTTLDHEHEWNDIVNFI